MRKPKPGRLSIGSILAFSLGGVNGGGAFKIVSLFYAYFLTDAMRLDPVLAAPIFLIGTIIDAVADPMIGYLSDHSKTAMGRRAIGSWL